MTEENINETIAEDGGLQACSFVEVDLNRTDPNFKDEVGREPGGEHIRLCYACGACSARCPVGLHKQGFDPRRMIRKIILGLRDEVLQSELPWRCSTCFTCQETCPQGVGFTEVLFAVKNIAVREGYFPAALAIQPELLKDHGRLLEITDFENDKRAELGLPKLEENSEHMRVLLKDFKVKAKGGGE